MTAESRRKAIEMRASTSTIVSPTFIRREIYNELRRKRRKERFTLFDCHKNACSDVQTKIEEGQCKGNVHCSPTKVEENMARNEAEKLKGREN
ncbi:hypothetical protein Csa_006508 [Cucumis sativus]|uniref:Uncharacterized protein n=1 Tax=Cucumis sativus TaxID=3659 RepID=A0A0A0LJU9_CUCSA|nr:hypothetical protein Csa_006508 [Cucumis sativus]